MTRFACKPPETSCLLSNLFIELRPVCGRCEGDNVVLCGLTYEGEEQTVVLRDYGFDYSGRRETVERIRKRRCINLSIYEKLLAANEIYPIQNEEDKVRRLSLQRDALTACKMLLFFIELSKKRGYIDTGTFDYWTKITLDVKFMAAAWYKAEQAPAEEAEKAEAPVAEPPTQTEG